MFEKRWAAVPPQSFTSNGTPGGVITVIDSSLFKVKQQVNITANTLPNLNLEVKSVPNDVTIVVGPVGTNIFTYSDISAYTTALSSAISANEQKRSSVPIEEINRAVYEEEPTVALRNVLVDKHGNKIDSDNPLPTTATIAGDVTIDVALDAFSKVPADNAIAVGTNDGTIAGTKRAHKIGADGKLETKDTDAKASLDNIENLLSNPLDVNTGGLTDAELRASPVPVSIANGNINVGTDGFDTLAPDSMLATGSEDGTKTGVKHAARIDADLDLRVGISDGANKASVDGAGQLSVKDVTAQTVLNNILTQLSSGVLKVDDDQTQTLLGSILTQLLAGGLVIGTENGTPTGTQHVFVNNLRKMITSAHDVVPTYTYADFGTKNQRITRIDYVSPTFPSVTIRRDFNYVLDSGRYRRINGPWSVV